MSKHSLVVASKIKAYIKNKTDGFNTSAAVMDELTKKVEKTLDDAIESAKRDGRITVMNRDIPSPGAQL